jgi:hypothetical protein
VSADELTGARMLVDTFVSCINLLKMAAEIDKTDGRAQANRFLEEFFEPTNNLRIYYLEQAGVELKQDPELNARIDLLMKDFNERLEPFLG